MPVSDPAMVTKTHHEGPSGTDPAGGNVPVVEETVAAAASALLTTKHTELPPTLDAAPPVESIKIGEIQVLEPVRHEDGKDSAVRLDRAEEIMPDSAAVMSSTEPAGEVDPPSVAAIDTISVAETLSTASETVRMSDRMTDQRVESPRATIVPMSRMRAEPALSGDHSNSRLRAGGPHPPSRSQPRRIGRLHRGAVAADGPGGR